MRWITHFICNQYTGIDAVQWHLDKIIIRNSLVLKMISHFWFSVGKNVENVQLRHKAMNMLTTRLMHNN